MDTTTSIITEAAGQFYHAPTWFILVAVIIVLGYVLKGIPAFPNQFIPLICAVIGAVIMPLIGDPSSLNKDQRHPYFVFVLMGLVIGMAAWACHGIILKRLEKKFGLFQADDPAQPKNNNENQTGRNTATVNRAVSDGSNNHDPGASH